MARLNEPAMSTDSLETLRRKFIRQNREIARINSNQSQRIRELENDCARMLSENLELRSQILHLENELDTSSTHRIADHALEVKAKLEAQLSIFSSLLQGLGTEPPKKRHSPSTRRLSKPKATISIASPARRLRIARDTEVMALQEGRLPAIPEHKPYPREPRATLNDEIRAMRGEPQPEDTTDSPDLGPPPISRFVDVDPVKVDSPSRNATAVMLDPDSDEHSANPGCGISAAKLDFTRIATSSREAVERNESVPARNDGAATPATSAVPAQPLRASAKRKFGDEENDGFRIAKQTDKPSKQSGATDRPRVLQDVQKRKIVKDPLVGRRDAKDNGSATAVPSLNPRKALAAKSTNDSPRKVKEPSGTEVSKSLKKQSTPGEEKIRDSAHSLPQKTTSRAPKKSLAVVQVPPPQPGTSAPALTTTIPEPETPLLELDLITPNTPDQRPAPATLDTPPPGMGEASRPSRRARPAISYAEPNLRDKMRRPTKELFDAVAGEGKFKARNSIAAPGTGQKLSDNSGSAARTGSSSAKGKDNARPGEGMSAVEMAVAKESSRRETALSPTPGAHQKDVSDLGAENEELPNTITTQRRKRGSSVGHPSSMDSLVASSTMTGTLNFAAKPSDVVPAADDGNVYDFESSSPASAQKAEEAKPLPTRAQPRKSRASSSFQENGSGSLTSDTGAGAKYAGRGKRASMAAAMTKLSMLELEDTEESSLEGEIVVRGDRMSRRKSMML